MGADDIAPRITKKPSLKQEDNGNRLVIHCEVEASPEPEIKWFKDSAILNQSSRVKASVKQVDNYFNIYLEIDNVTSDDSGAYKVTTKNRLGEVSASVSLNFAAETAQSPSEMKGIAPNFIEKPSIKSDADGKRLCFECKIKADPEPNVQWFRNDVEVIDKGRHLIYCDKLNDNMYFACLEIDDVNAEDAGKYRVQAKNSLGESNATINLNFDTEAPQQDDSSSKKPIFTEKPLIRQLEDKILFEIKLTADPVPTITWELDKKVLNNPAKYKQRVLSDGNAHTFILEILNAGAKDSGDYKAIAKNKHGEGQANIKLNIQSNKLDGLPDGIAPHFASQPRILQEQQKLILEIEIKAQPTPSVTWYLNDKDLSDAQNSRFVIKNLRKANNIYLIQLEMSDPKNSDTGLYRCIASNELGDCISNFNLQFQANKGSLSKTDLIPPTLLEKPSIITDEARKCVRFEVKLKAKPETQVTWFKNSEALKASNKYKFDVKKEADNVYILILEINDFKPDDGGIYKVQARNEIGQSNVLIHLNVQQIEDAPKFIGAPKIIKEDDGKLIVFEIDCDSKTQPDCQWIFNSKPLKNEGRYFYEVVKAQNRYKIILELDNPQPNDAGVYTVIAKNPNGSAETSVNFQPEDKKTEEKKPEQKKPEEKKPEEKKPEEKKPEEKKPEQKKPEEKKPEEKKPEAKPKDAEPETKGKNDIAKKPSPPSGAPASFKEKPKDQVVFDGDRVTITCKVTGDPKPEITWFRHKQPLKKSKDFNMEHTGEVAKLVINDAYVDDTGEYGCEVWNEAGQQTANFKVTVKEKKGKMKRTRPAIKDDGKKTEDEARKEKRKQEAEAKNKKNEPVPVIAPEIAAPVISEPVPEIQLPEGDNLSVPEGSAPHKKNSLDVREQVPILGGIQEPIYEEEGPRRAPKNLLSEDSQAPGRPSRKVSQPSIKLDVIDESGAKMHVSERKPKNPLPKSTEKKAPIFIEKPENKIIMETQSDFIEAIIDGNPFPAVQWFKGPRECFEGPKHSFELDQASGVVGLKILKAKSDDEAKYTLRIHNELGEEKCTFSVFVKSPKITTEEPIEEPEKFVKPLEDKHVKEEDGTIKLTCQFCKSHGKLRWYKNKQEIFHGLKFHFETEGPVQSLIINRLNPDDEGKYICKVNEVETFAYLTVEPAKPKFEFTKKLLAKLEAFRTKPATLECFVNHDDCNPQWLKNGVPIKPDDKKYRITREPLTGRCTLKIAKVTKDDECEFSCVIDGVDKTSCFVYVEEPEFRFTKRLPPQTESQENAVVELECEIEDPDAECEWQFDGRTIDPKELPEKYTVIADGTKRRLLIKNLNPVKDPGRYECKCGFNITGTQLFVKEALKLVKPLENTEGVEESPIELSFTLNKDDQKPKWYRNGRQIVPGEPKFERYTIAAVGKKHTLKIDKLDLKDAGEIEAKIDFVTTKCQFTVKECEKVPRIDPSNIPKNIRIKAGKDLVLEVPYESFPIPSATWKRNGEPLGDRKGLQSNDNKLAQLKIPKVTRGDMGKYEVVLKNSKGEIVVPIQVDVSDKPTAPQGPLKVSDVTNQTAVLSWQPPEDDGGCPITDYIIEKMDVSRGEWSPVDVISGTQTNYKVNKLTPKKEYLFRIRAVNSEGESPNLESKGPTLAKNPYDEPGKPIKPDITDWNNDRIEVSWKTPDNDGGAPIEKYIVEKREKGKQWTKAAETQPGSTKVTVPNLKEGTEYEFRVTAVNKAGAGEPSEPSRPQITKHRNVAPRIDKSMLKAITVKATQPVNIDVPFLAEPLPSLHWTFNGSDVTKDDRFASAMSERNLKLSIQNTKRSDTGKYLVKLTNEHGSDSAEIDIIILSAPSKPKGPIEVKDVKKDSITIAWQKPEDNGGKEVDRYIVEKKDKKSDTWERVNDGVLGTSLTIPKLKEGHEYEFRVVAVNANGTSEPLVTDSPIKAKNPFERPDAPGKPECTNRSLNHIEVSWKPPIDDGGAPIQNYIVERKEKNSKKWSRISKESFKGLTYVDEKVLPRKEYEYRVIAVNEGGESEPSLPTGLIPAQPEKEKPQFDKEKLDGPLKEIKVRAGEPIKINLPIIGSPAPIVTWTKDGTQLENNKDGVQLDNDDTKAALYIPKAKRGDTGNYEVKLENPEGSDSLPIKVIVLDKPGKCEGPIELVDSSKTSVTLAWKPPKDDGGSDITGYSVERCPEGSDKWEKCPGLFTQPKAIVKGLTEGKSYTFRVRAENIYGEGEPLETKNAIVVKPPYDPPGPPSQPEVIDSGFNFIRIQWKKPENDGGNPVTGYMVEIKPKNATEWTPCNNFPTKTNEYTASNLSDGQTYELRVRAVNEAGPGAPSKPTKPQKAEPPTYVASACDQPKVEAVTKDSVTLSWKKPLDDGGAKITNYVIEKKTGDGKWEEILEVPAKDNNQATIKDVKEGEECQFRVKAKNSAGLSEPSKATDVIKVEDQPEKPSFDIGFVKDIVVKCGQNYEIHIPYKAIPKPTAEWTINEKEIVPEERIKVNVLDNVVTLVNLSAQRKDTGLYKLTLRNREGTNSTNVRVTVLDRPSAPEGPLEVTDLDAESCTLIWKEPKDNGGNDVTNYVVEKREAGTEKWIKVSNNNSGTSCPVKGLENGKKYEFRVVAENVSGQSDPLVSSEQVKAKWPFNPPGAPGVPVCTDHTDSSITLAWTKPKQDGGNPVLGYVIEKREKGTDKWIPVTHTGDRIPENEFTVKGLQDGKEYEFRVAAVNKAGPGDWAETEEAIEARPADSAPKAVGIHNNTKEITVKAGEDIKINIPYQGTPKPKVTWTKGGDDLREDDRLKFNVDKTSIQLVARKATLNDSGIYSCIMKNNLGQDRVTIKVNVVDRPSQPQGPLEISDIKADGCVLTWKPPKEEGGSPITNYIIEKFDTKKNDWKKVSSYCRGTTYEVAGLDEGKSYKFRVSAENAYGVSDPLESEQPIVAKNPISVPNAPTGVKITDSKPDSVTLQWTAPDQGKDAVGPKALFYNVEALNPETGKWEPVNDVPIRSNSFKIDNLKPGVDYAFRVKAKNSAGWGEPSKEEVSITLKPECVKPDAPGAPQPKKVGKKFVQLTWTPPENDGGSKITGYVIEKKLAGADNWSKVNNFPILDTEWTVSDLTDNADYEFRVKAINKAGESEPSYSSGMIKITEFPGGRAPEFLKKIVNQEAAVGSSVTFTVDFEGKPLPTAKWMKNGIEVSPSPRYNIVQNEYTASFTIKDLWETDNGSQITCLLVNPLGKDSCEAVLKIKAAPKVEKEPGDQTAELGDTVKIKIPISGKGPFDFKLKKDDSPVELGRIKVNENDGTVTLTIPAAERDDTGRYQLTIANESGPATVNFRLKVKAPPSAPTGPLEAKMTSKSQCVLQWRPPADDGGSKVIHYVIEKRDCAKGEECWVPCGDNIRDTQGTVPNLLDNHEYEFRVMAVNQNGTSEPLVTATKIVAKLDFSPPGAPIDPHVQKVGSNFVTLNWSKPSTDGGGPISGYWIEKREKGQGDDRWIRCNPNIQTGLSFTVPNLVEDREYEFRLFAENEAGLSQPAQTSSVKVHDPDAPVAPDFVKRLSDVDASEGRTVTLEVEVSGNPKPQVQWFKGAKEIHENAKFSLSNDGDKYTLTINNISPDDVDEYIVKIRNKSGSKSSKANVTVRSAPKIKLPARLKDTVTYDKGETVTIRIPYTGSPLPKAEWSKNGVPIDASDSYRFDVTETNAVIVLKSTDGSHTGEYQLKLENPIGSDSCKFNIQIMDVPDAPRNVRVIETDAETVKLAWDPPVNNGGSDISHYIIEKSEISTTTSVQLWTRAAVTRSPTHWVENLEANRKYQFRIFAENVQGRSKPSDPTETVLTKESEAERRRKRIGADGKRKRGQDGPIPSDYDKCFHDLWANGQKPSPAYTQPGSVYDLYDIYEEIGRGAFGVVHRAVERRTGKTFAAKFVPTPTTADKATVRKECEVMNDLIHPKLLNLHDIFEEPDETVLITEFLSGGELFDKIADPNYKMTEEEAKKYIRQLCNALQHMHENNYVHLDIKPENLIFETKNSPNIKLIDFGLTSKLDPEAVVKVSSGTIEFSAPEIVEHDSVGFSTDMWAVGVLSYVLLSGLSPFSGNDDNETAENIKKCDPKFPSDFFNGISDDAFDFMRRLIVKSKPNRMTVFEALEHPWLAEDKVNDTRIPNSRYDAVKNRFKGKGNAGDPEPRLALGRSANMSSLKKLQPKQYNIYSSYFDRRDAAPRFILKPRNVQVLEGQNAEFRCVIVAPSPPLVNWFRENVEIKQSFKFMKKYRLNTYELEIKRCAVADKGEYVVKASNYYGERECIVLLTVTPLPEAAPVEQVQVAHRRRRAQDMQWDLWREADLKPVFTFLLRPRLIQAGIGVKLLCCLSGKPVPKVTWYKGSAELDTRNPHYSITFSNGVCTLEIASTVLDDSGNYTCKGENPLGMDETTCYLFIEECKYKEKKPSALLAEGGFSSSRSTSLQPERRRISQQEPREEKPKFIRKIASYKMQSVGDSVSLKSQFTGYPSPQAQWLKNGESLSSSSRVVISSIDDESSLTIKDLQVSDEGEYTCKVSNSQGYEVCKCQLEIEKPRPKPQPVIIDEKPAVERKIIEKPPTPVLEPAAEVVIPEEQPQPTAAEKVIDDKIEAVAEVVAEEEAAEQKSEAVVVEAPVVEEKKPEPVVQQKVEPVIEPVVEIKPETKVEPAAQPVVEAKIEPKVKPKVEQKVEKKVEQKIEPKVEKKVEQKVEASVAPVVEKKEEPVVVEKKAIVQEEKVKKPKEIFKFEKHLKSQNLNEGQQMTLECDVQGPEPIEVVWFRNNKEIPENPDFLKQRIDNVFKLTVNEIFPEDSGIFSAELFSESLNKAKVSSCSIVVQAQDEEELDPKFIEFPQSANAEEGGSIKFTCVVDGSDPLSVKWSKNGKELEESSRFKFTSNPADGVFSFEIPTVLATDEGEYQAIASSSKGDVIAAFNLNVDFEDGESTLDVQQILKKI